MTAARVALITPWPPDHSGIADFARDLALGLRNAGLAVSVFTAASSPSPCKGIEITSVSSDWSGIELETFDHRLFQLGNHVEFHGWMLRAMINYPGVVEVHDIVLHHLLIGLTCAEGNWPDYLCAVSDWYGVELVARAEAPLRGGARPIWETAEVVDVPFFEIFLEHAAGIVVHSRYAAMQIASTLPAVPLRQVVQAYLHRPPRPRQALKRIGIFGGVQDNKKLDWILEAFGYLDAYLTGIEVTVVGTVVPQCEALVDRAKTLDHLDIRFVGRVDEQTFVDELERTDLCISLRYPTMGETSAIVMRAVQLGIPTIVSDTGWYAELPVEVLKAPLDNTPHYLSSMIHRLVTQPDQYRSWAEECSDMPARMGLSHHRMCADLSDFLQSFRAERFVSETVARHLAELGFNGDETELHVLATIEPRARLHG